MRIYAGQGEGGQIAVAANIMPGTLSAAGGAGVLAIPATQIDMHNAQMVQAVQNVLLGPPGFRWVWTRGESIRAAHGATRERIHDVSSPGLRG